MVLWCPGATGPLGVWQWLLAYQTAQQPANVGLWLRVQPELGGVALPGSLQILVGNLGVCRSVTGPRGLQTWRSAEGSTLLGARRAAREPTDVTLGWLYTVERSAG